MPKAAMVEWLHLFILAIMDTNMLSNYSCKILAVQASIWITETVMAWLHWCCTWATFSNIWCYARIGKAELLKQNLQSRSGQIWFTRNITTVRFARVRWEKNDLQCYESWTEATILWQSSCERGWGSQSRIMINVLNLGQTTRWWSLLKPQ